MVNYSKQSINHLLNNLTFNGDWIRFGNRGVTGRDDNGDIPAYPSDADFIAAAPAIVRQLLEELEQLQQTTKPQYTVASGGEYKVDLVPLTRKWPNAVIRSMIDDLTAQGRWAWTINGRGRIYQLWNAMKDDQPIPENAYDANWITKSVHIVKELLEENERLSARLTELEQGEPDIWVSGIGVRMTNLSNNGEWESIGAASAPYRDRSFIIHDDRRPHVSVIVTHDDFVFMTEAPAIVRRLIAEVKRLKTAAPAQDAPPPPPKFKPGDWVTLYGVLGYDDNTHGTVMKVTARGNGNNYFEVFVLGKTLTIHVGNLKAVEG